MLGVVGKHHLLLDLAMRLTVGVSDDRLGSSQNGFDMAEALMAQGRRKQQVLAVRITSRGDRVHVFGEAHVQHSVCLIQYQHFEVLKVQATLLKVFHQSAGGGNHHLRVLPNRSDLMLEGFAANDESTFYRCESREFFKHLLGL